MIFFYSVDEKAQVPKNIFLSFKNSFDKHTIPPKTVFIKTHILQNCSHKIKNPSSKTNSFQRLGYAEANPAFDIGGGDARAKAIILCRMLGDNFDTDKIHLEGITNITQDMVVDAKSRGKR